VIVYLLRHGNAEDHPARGGDAARELTSEGVERLERAGPAWRRVVGQVDRILVSPLARAQQTAEVFRRAIGTRGPVETTPVLVPAANPLDALDVLQAGCREGLRGIACVGHEPNLGALLGLLLTGSDRTPIPFKKGMLAVVEVDSSAHMIGRLLAAMSQKIAAGL